MLTENELVSAGATPNEASLILRELQGLPHQCCIAEAWRHVSKHALSPDTSFAVHKVVAAAVFRDWKEDELGPHPLWFPSPCAASQTNLASFMSSHPHLLRPSAASHLPSHGRDLVADVALLHATSVDHPERFWPPLLKELRIQWDTQPSAVLALDDASDPDSCRWFPGARINIAKAALSGRDPDAPAIVFASEDEPRRPRTVTYAQLQRHATAVAASLLEIGLGPGDAVAIVMPMTWQAVVVYLGIVLMGGAVVSIAESFSAEEMATRLAIARTRAVITQDVVARGGKALPLYSRIAALPRPRPFAIVMSANKSSAPAVALQEGDIPWAEFIRKAASSSGFAPHIADPYETTNILFSSGTTGEPKAIPWTHLTPLRAGVDAWACHDLRPGDVILWPTSLGWMMGPWLVYAALLNGAAIGLFQGSPVSRAFGEFVESARVTVVGLVPSIAKGWRSSGCMQGLDWGCVRCFSSSGEASAPDDAHWLMARAGYKPILEYCGGTEIGGAFASSTLLHPSVPSAFSTLTLGIDLFLSPPEMSPPTPPSDSTPALLQLPLLVPLRDRTPARGEVMLAAPALGMSQTLLNRSHRDVYYKGMPRRWNCGVGGEVPLRRHGDEFEVLPGGCYRALGRVDDTMNLGGIKVSSVELERICVKHVRDVVQAAAVADSASGGGPDRLVMFVVLRDRRADLPTDALRTLTQACQDAIRSHLNPLFKVHGVIVCDSLPVNASNKVMRRVLRDQLRAASKQVARL